MAANSDWLQSGTLSWILGEAFLLCGGIGACWAPLRSHNSSIGRAGSVVGPWTAHENGEPEPTRTAQVHEQLVSEGQRTVVQVIEVK